MISLVMFLFFVCVYFDLACRFELVFMKLADDKYNGSQIDNIQFISSHNCDRDDDDDDGVRHRRHQQGRIRRVVRSL